MKFWQVDAFTNDIFHGNPAAVFILNNDISDDLKQKIAREMNLSETVFIVWNGSGSAAIRWFTPNSEVDLCGHATLAAAHILWTEGFYNKDALAFSSKSGPLSVLKGEDRFYTLDFPSQPGRAKPDYAPQMEQILKAQPLFIGSNSRDCMAVLKSSREVKSFAPDLDKIARLSEDGLLITAKDETGRADYVYRAFFPKLDVPEDPVTGSANTLLAPYWAKELNKQKLKAYQASARGGHLKLELTDNNRVLITGQAVTVFEGSFK